MFHIVNTHIADKWSCRSVIGCRYTFCSFFTLFSDTTDTKAESGGTILSLRRRSALAENPAIVANLIDVLTVSVCRTLMQTSGQKRVLIAQDICQAATPVRWSFEPWGSLKHLSVIHLTSFNRAHCYSLTRLGRVATLKPDGGVISNPLDFSGFTRRVIADQGLISLFVF